MPRKGRTTCVSCMRCSCTWDWAWRTSGEIHGKQQERVHVDWSDVCWLRLHLYLELTSSRSWASSGLFALAEFEHSPRRLGRSKTCSFCSQLNKRL